MNIAAHTEQELRKMFAEAWLDQEIQLRRIGFSPRDLHWAQRAAWLVFVALWRKLNSS